jgi:GWxTD domain-containing protein
MLISVKLFETSEGRILADTVSFTAEIVKETGKLDYVYNIPLNVRKGAEYLAEVKILDRLRLKVSQAFITFTTTSDFNKYNFSFYSHISKNELFQPVLKPDNYINIRYLRGNPDSLYIFYYPKFEPIPDPPSLIVPEKVLDYGPIQSAVIPYSDTLPIMLPREGIYKFTVGRDIQEGITLYNFGESFPETRKPEDMISPLAYLASSDEIESLKNSDKLKLAVDEFWISCGGNVEKARELIRIYYTRVQFANYYFTSYKEGWRTERGMIYIMYGPPDKVYKTDDGENWGYRKPPVQSRWGSRYSSKEEYLFFNFKKKPPVLSDNDFYLSRTESLVTMWDKAVLSWRKGIVFRIDNPEDL